MPGCIIRVRRIVLTTTAVNRVPYAWNFSQKCSQLLSSFLPLCYRTVSEAYGPPLNGTFGGTCGLYSELSYRLPAGKGRWRCYTGPYQLQKLVYLTLFIQYLCSIRLVYHFIDNLRLLEGFFTLIASAVSKSCTTSIVPLWFRLNDGFYMLAVLLVISWEEDGSMRWCDFILLTLNFNIHQGACCEWWHLHPGLDNTRTCTGVGRCRSRQCRLELSIW